MITRKMILLYVAFALAAVAVAWAEGPIEVKGFAVPESVFYDAAGDYYLVSNINGKPTDVDGNGFISKLAPDGTVIARRWIDGAAEGVTLSAPKGMAIVGNTLYVTDITAVRMFDRASGQPKGSIAIAGAEFLNDPAAAPDGTLYVSDMNTQKVHRIAPDGTVSTVAAGERLAGPNGVAVDGRGALYVCSMNAPEVFRLSAGGTKDKAWEVPAAGLDGLVLLPDGGFLVSSWKAATVYRVTRNGDVTPVLTGINSPADIGLDAKRNRILVPVFTENRVLIVPLDGAPGRVDD